MVHATVLFTGLLTALVGATPDLHQDVHTYESMRANAGKDSRAQISLALWCEARGLNRERLEHLAQAIISDPNNVTARGLLGQVSSAGRWELADTIWQRINADEQRQIKRTEYDGRRAKLAEKEVSVRRAEERHKAAGRLEAAFIVRSRGNHDLSQAHARLGTWSEQNGLQPEAKAHFTAAVHLDPSRESSWRHMGSVKHNGQWMSPEQAAALDREERDQRQANRRWEPQLRKWKIWLADQASASRRAEAKKQLASVTDPRAIPSILKLFPRDGSESDQVHLLQLLGQIDAPTSSRAVADLAVMTRLDSVRMTTIDVLKKRPSRDYAGLLVEMIRGKIHHTVVPIDGPGSTGSLMLDTPRIRMVLTYDSPAVFQPAVSFRGYAGYDSNGLPVIVQGRELERGVINPRRLDEIEVRTAELIGAANVKARIVHQRMVSDLSEVELINEQSEQLNARITPVLEIAAGAPLNLKDDEDAWHVWWYDTLGYSYQSPPQVTLAQDASPSQLPPPYVTTCFVAGTPVRTLDGLQPIEAIRVGDQVLSQDAATGGLSFQSVLFLHHNPPGKTLRVSISNGESLVCSVYHRFWRANLGWTMARELKPGDTLRAFGALVQVVRVEPDSIQPLYNLDTAGPRTFFVGSSNLLVHDNTLPDHRLKPFDALPALETLQRSQ